MRTVREVLSLAALLPLLSLVPCGCISAGGDASTPPCASTPAEPPLKVGVYADAGPSGIGASEWFLIVEESPEMELHLLDGNTIRAGALDGLDVLVMPGGDSKTEYTSLGAEGVERMKEFIRSGGGYVGTCAGCCLLMDGKDRRARVMPWNTKGSEPDTFFPTIQINEKGAAALGVKAGPHKIRYHGGPFMRPTTNVIDGADFEEWGVFDAEASMTGRISSKKQMYGSAAVIGGRYGKGRVFATSAHPEYFDSTLYVVQAAFRYVTGRDVTFPPRLRSPRSLSVGFLATGINGIESAKTMLALAAEKDFDLVLIDVDGIRRRALDHIDVLVLPSDKPIAVKVLSDGVRDFAARGGKVVGFGKGVKALPKGGVACGPGREAVRAIRALNMRPTCR